MSRTKKFINNILIEDFETFRNETLSKHDEELIQNFKSFIVSVIDTNIPKRSFENVLSEIPAGYKSTLNKRRFYLWNVGTVYKKEDGGSLDKNLIRFAQHLQPDGFLLNELCLNYGKGTKEEIRKMNDEFNNNCKENLKYTVVTLVKSQKKTDWIRGSAILIRNDIAQQFRHRTPEYNRKHGYEVATVYDTKLKVLVKCFYVQNLSTSTAKIAVAESLLKPVDKDSVAAGDYNWPVKQFIEARKKSMKNTKIAELVSIVFRNTHHGGGAIFRPKQIDYVFTTIKERTIVHEPLRPDSGLSEAHFPIPFDIYLDDHGKNDAECASDCDVQCKIRREKLTKQKQEMNSRTIKKEEPSDVQSVEEKPAIEDGNSTASKWLLLRNSGSDCFLNAALQFLRRALNVKVYLENRNIDKKTDFLDPKEVALRRLHELMVNCGTDNVTYFRCLLCAIGRLEADFLTRQQDANEALTKIFEAILPPDIKRQFSITTSQRVRCLSDPGCRWGDLPSMKMEHLDIRNDHQIVDLEGTLIAQWPYEIEQGIREHCPSCCSCCMSDSTSHTDRSCACFEKERACQRKQRFDVESDAQYVIVPFNTVDLYGRNDWALAEKCDLDSMSLFGMKWKAVAIIKHIGAAGESGSWGHYVTVTKEDDGQWWLHDDAQEPEPIGTSYHLPSSHTYPSRVTDMAGVTMILFQKQ